MVVLARNTPATIIAQNSQYSMAQWQHPLALWLLLSSSIDYLHASLLDISSLPLPTKTAATHAFTLILQVFGRLYAHEHTCRLIEDHVMSAHAEHDSAPSPVQYTPLHQTLRLLQRCADLQNPPVPLAGACVHFLHAAFRGDPMRTYATIIQCGLITQSGMCLLRHVFFYFSFN